MLGKISLTDSPKTLQQQHTNLCSTTPLKCISKLHVHIYCSLFTIYLNASHICSMLLCQNIHFICMEKISQFSHFSSPDIEEIEAKWSLYINHPSIIDSRNISWMFCKYQNKYIIVFCCTNNIYNRYSKLFFFSKLKSMNFPTENAKALSILKILQDTYYHTYPKKTSK